MSTPEDGGSAVDPVDPATAPVPEPIPTQTPTDADIRDLASQLNAPALSYTPMDMRKGTITAITGATVSLTISGDDTVTITEVRYIDSYSPVVGDIVQIEKQGTDICVLGQINTTTQGGSSQGWAVVGSAVQARVVVDNGDQKVQLKGVYQNLSAGATHLFNLTGLLIPTADRTIICGRNGNAASVKVRITTGTGSVDLLEHTNIPDSDSTTPGQGGSTTPVGVGGTTPGPTGSGSTGSSTDDAQLVGFTSAVSGPSHSHSHGGAVSNTSFGETHQHGFGNLNPHSHGLSGSHTHTSANHNHSSPEHSHSSAAHSHTITLGGPTFVYFDGLEFFI